MGFCGLSKIRRSVYFLYLGEVLGVFELDRTVTSPAQDPFPCEPSGPLLEMGSIPLTLISQSRWGDSRIILINVTLQLVMTFQCL